MPRLTVAHVADVCGGSVAGDAAAVAHGVVADSREVTGGLAFAAVRGGAAYVGDAFAAGAPIVIASSPHEAPAGAAVVVVDDVVAALGCLAADVRSRLRARVVGITGSTGKTLTKDFLAAALGAMERSDSDRLAVHATPRSFNAELGVPLVVLTCPDDADVLVVELGARHPGEVADLARMVRPDVGVITGIGISHLSEFGSRHAIARTKCELLGALPAGGDALVPSDDDYLALMSDTSAARMTTVGPGGHISYRATMVDADGRTHGSIGSGDEVVDVTLPVAGRGLMRNAALAVAAAGRLGVAIHESGARISRTRTSLWRMQIVEMSGLVVVNDAWNANPTSTTSALRTVAELARGRERWAVLGTMAELGPLGPDAHRRVGRLARALGFTGVVTVGDEATGIAAGAGPVAVVAGDADEAADIVARRASPGAWVLVKASRVVGLERFPDKLAARVGV